MPCFTTYCDTAFVNGVGGRENFNMKPLTGKVTLEECCAWCAEKTVSVFEKNFSVFIGTENHSTRTSGPGTRGGPEADLKGKL